MPDPMLALADIQKSAPFTLAGKKGRVIPQHLEAGSKFYHSKFFYIEYPAEGGQLFQIDAARVVAITGDGGTRRHFSATEVASLFAGLSPKLDIFNFLKAVSL